MPTLSQAPALSPSHRYLTAILLRMRRFINRSVANMLANRERAAMQFVKEPGHHQKARNDRMGVRSLLLGVIVAGSLLPAAATTQQPAIRDHRGDSAQRAVRTQCKLRRPVQMPTADGVMTAISL